MVVLGRAGRLVDNSELRSVANTLAVFSRMLGVSVVVVVLAWSWAWARGRGLVGVAPVVSVCLVWSTWWRCAAVAGDGRVVLSRGERRRLWSLATKLAGVGSAGGEVPEEPAARKNSEEHRDGTERKRKRVDGRCGRRWKEME